MELNDFILSPAPCSLEIKNVFQKYTASSKTTKQKFTVAKVNRNTATNMLIGEMFQKEIEVLGFLDHPNIQVYFDCFYDSNNMYLFLEHEEKSFYSLYEGEGSMDDHSLFLIFKQIVDAVSYIHSLNIVHLDIEPESFFIINGSHLKLGNFYFSENIEKGQLIQKPYGTLNFAAPETKLKYPYDGKKADVYACGLMLISMIKKQLAISGNTQQDINECFVNDSVKIPNHIQGDIRELIDCMVEKDPLKRISIDDVYQSNWFKKNNTLT